MTEQLMELADTLGGMCWKCTRCGWVDCYSAEDLATYGAPTECQRHYDESLVEIDLAEGWAVLADKAATKVREAARDLDDAKDHAAQVERTLAALRARAQSNNLGSGDE